MDLSEFVRLFPLRKGQLMWLLGAGCSVASGIPTAADMVWDFKRLLFCSENRRSLSAVPHLSDPGFRAKLAHFMSSKPGFPRSGSAEEYSFYFENTYPDERERRRYIVEIVRGSEPSVGHRILAQLIANKTAAYIWTTNFDRLIENAYVEQVGTASDLIVVNTDNTEVARHSIAENADRMLVKLHGDFHSRRLKNTAVELQSQDATLRSVLSNSIGRFGLIVVGYSGRDASVMDALTEGLHVFGKDAFPGGLFWIMRPNGTLGPEAANLISLARSSGVNACLIASSSFDEFMQDITTLDESITVPKALSQARASARLSANELPPEGDGWPVLRLNAIPVTSFPTVCRLVDCDIGNTREIQAEIAKKQLSVVGVRKRYGVVCFGSDRDVREAFSDYNIRSLGLHSVDLAELGRDSALLGLYNQAIAHAIARECDLSLDRKRNQWILSVPEVAWEDNRYLCLREAQGLGGVIANTGLKWRSAISIRLQILLDRVWLSFDPTEFVDLSVDDSGVFDRRVLHEVKEFRRERSAKVFNRQLNALFDIWMKILFHDNKESEISVRCFSVGDGIDAVFRLSPITAFSRRIQ